MNTEIRHCLRNLTELCNLDNDTPDIIEAMLDVVMEGRLKLIYDKGEVFFQSSEFKENEDN